MILTASIIWAVLVDPMTYVVGALVGTNLYALAGWAYNLHWRRKWRTNAEAALDLASRAGVQRDTWRQIAIDLQDKIDRDASKRSSITSRGNITRAAKRRALVQAKAAELRGAEPDRIAA